MADTDNATVRKITADGRVTTLAGVANQFGLREGKLPGFLSRPQGIALSPAGDLAVTSGNAVMIITAP